MTRRATPSGTSITMPDWNEEGLVLSVRPHGENSALVTLLTAGQGRHAGLVRGASSAKMRGVGTSSAASSGKSAWKCQSFTYPPPGDGANADSGTRTRGRP